MFESKSAVVDIISMRYDHANGCMSYILKSALFNASKSVHKGDEY